MLRFFCVCYVLNTFPSLFLCEILLHLRFISFFVLFRCSFFCEIVTEIGYKIEALHSKKAFIFNEYSERFSSTEWSRCGQKCLEVSNLRHPNDGIHQLSIARLHCDPGSKLVKATIEAWHSRPSRSWSRASSKNSSPPPLQNVVNFPKLNKSNTKKNPSLQIKCNYSAN